MPRKEKISKNQGGNLVLVKYPTNITLHFPMGNVPNQAHMDMSESDAKQI